MSILTIDPEFKALIPPLTSEEYDQLEMNLVYEGCRDSLVTWNGILIDGHNRYEICTKNSLYFETVDVNESNDADVKSRTDVIEWIINNQLGRRNLNNYDRSVLALKRKENISAKAKEKQTEGINQYSLCQKSDKPTIDTKKELAKIAGVSHDTIHKVEVIETQAPAEIKTQVKAGELSINQAYILTKSATEAKKKNEEYEKQYREGLEKERQASLEKEKQEELEASLPVNAVVLDKFRKQEETHIFGITDFSNLEEEQWDKCVKHARKYEDPIYYLTIAYTDIDSLRAWECIMDQEDLESQKESINLAIQNLIKIQNYFKGVKR